MRSSELRIMALRQKQQIDKQQQLLAAREQRLRFLKSQEANEFAVAAESERLRRLRERVEAQESKLRRLRALRGQVDLQKTYNVSLGNDLDSIRALFSEKEKELTLAVAKVEALTRQLEELRRDRRANLNFFSSFPNHYGLSNSSAIIELDNLRSELMYRNQLSLQQDARLHLQRDTLHKKQAELQSVDQRILELQGRLNKKRSSHEISNKLLSKTLSPMNNSGCFARSVTSSFHSHNKSPKSNVVAVGPFNHFPEKIVSQGTIRHKINVQSDSNEGNVINLHTVDIKSNHNRHGLTDETSTMDFCLAPDSDEHKLAAMHNKLLIDFRDANKFENLILTTDKTLNSNKTTGSEQEMSHGGIGLDNNKSSIKPKIDPNSDEKKSKIITTNNDEMKDECDNDKTSDSLSCVKIITPLQCTPLLVNKSIANPMHHDTTSHNQNVFMDSSMCYLKQMGTKKTTISINSNEKNIHLVEPQCKSMDISSDLDSIEKIKPALPPKPYKQNVVAESSSEISVAKIGSQSEQSLTNMFYFSKGSAYDNTIPDSLPIKARPLTIKKSPYSEHPRLKQNQISSQKNQVSHRASEIAQTFPLSDGENSDDILLAGKVQFSPQIKELDKKSKSDNLANKSLSGQNLTFDEIEDIDINKERGEVSKNTCKEDISKRKRNFFSCATSDGNIKFARRVSFDPLALLLDASLEGELELVKITASQVSNPSAANDEGITALHNAICAGHFEIVKFLVEFGCDVNAQDSDGWTPLHCAASCNNLAMVKFLVESGACLFASTLSDHETPAEKCEEDEEGYDGCSEYLYNIQEKLGIFNNGEVYAVFSYEAQQSDELEFSINDKFMIIRKGDESEREWWWARDDSGKEGYIPRNLLGLHPRIAPSYNVADKNLV